MKHTIIGAAVALSFLVAGIAQAAPQSQTDASVAVTAPRATYALGASEFNDFANAYALSNGQVAKFTQQGNHYFIQLKSTLRSMQRDESNGQRIVSTRLRPVGPGRFVTDTGAELQFREQGDEVTISNFERLPSAKVAANVSNVMMIARR
jgi:hypothetical protein